MLPRTGSGRWAAFDHLDPIVCFCLDLHTYIFADVKSEFIAGRRLAYNREKNFGRLMQAEDTPWQGRGECVFVTLFELS